jgi:hypothetical protein
MQAEPRRLSALQAWRPAARLWVPISSIIGPGVAVSRQSAEQGQERRHQAEAVAGTIHSIENRSGEKLASQSIRWYNHVIPM